MGLLAVIGRATNGRPSRRAPQMCSSRLHGALQGPDYFIGYEVPETEF